MGAAASLPPVTRALLLSNLAVQLVLTFAGVAFANRVFMDFGLVPARLTGMGTLPGASVPPVLTLLTALFVHGGWFHLGMNALFLIVIARFVEPLLGPGRFLGLYVLGGIAGGLAQTLVAPGSLEPVVGASGAISAVFGTYVMRFAARGAPEAEWRIALRYAAAFGGLQALVALADLGIAVWAHVGGFLVGLALASSARLTR